MQEFVWNSVVINDNNKNVNLLTSGHKTAEHNISGWIELYFKMRKLIFQRVIDKKIYI